MTNHDGCCITPFRYRPSPTRHQKNTKNSVFLVTIENTGFFSSAACSFLSFSLGFYFNGDIFGAHCTYLFFKLWRSTVLTIYHNGRKFFFASQNLSMLDECPLVSHQNYLLSKFVSEHHLWNHRLTRLHLPIITGMAKKSTCLGLDQSLPCCDEQRNVCYPTFGTASSYRRLMPFQ